MTTTRNASVLRAFYEVVRMGKPILIDEHTYGYYDENEGTFTCSHGAWWSKIKLLNDTNCEIEDVPSATTYELIDKIPEGYDRV